MDKFLMTHVKRIKSCMVRGKFDRSKVTDKFAMQISMTVVDNAIKNGTITEKQFKQALARK